MTRQTLGDVRNTISRVMQLQNNADSDAVRERVNEAQARLLKLGKWPDMQARYSFCTYEGCIVLPRELDALLGFAVDRLPRRINSGWYEFMETGPGIMGPGGWGDAIDRGSTVVFHQLCTPSYIRVYMDATESTTSTVPNAMSILIKGTDQFGNRVMTYNGTDLIDGEYVSLTGSNPASTTNVFASIDAVVKPVTKGFVRLYSWDGASTQSVIAIYHPTEINPTYRWYAIPGLQPQPNLTPLHPHTVTVYATRRFIPAVLDTDDLFITNIGALKYMVMALEKEERNQEDKAAYDEQRAVQLLNFDLKEHMGGAVPKPSFHLHGYYGGDIFAER